MNPKNNKTVEVPVEWFERLSELRDVAIDEYNKNKNFDGFNVLSGYIDSIKSFLL